MFPLKFSILLLLFCFVVATISKTADNDPGCCDLISSPRNQTRSRLHLPIPAETKTKRPRKFLDREGGSRLLTRKNRKSRQKKLDKSSFLGLMGDDFKDSWMTYNEPKKPIISIPPDEIRNLTAVQGSWATTELESDLRRLNLTADLEKFAPELLPQEDMIRQFLLKRTSCPIQFTWKDLGNKYWPRWVRQGECVHRDGLCSFPPGMICVPGVWTLVHLLEWKCTKKPDRGSRSLNFEDSHYIEYKRPAPIPLNRKGKPKKINVLDLPEMETTVVYKKKVPRLPSGPIHLPRKKRKCEWEKVPYPITIDCFCAC